MGVDCLRVSFTSERFKTMGKCVFSNLCEKAEDTGGFVWITKSNSLRRTAKEKEKTRKDLGDKIVNVVDELKNTCTFTCLLAGLYRLYEKLIIL